MWGVEGGQSRATTTILKLDNSSLTSRGPCREQC